MKTPNNKTTITELRNYLLESITELHENKIREPRAREINNLAGKVISTAKVQIDYAKLHKQPIHIPFIAEDAGGAS